MKILVTGCKGQLGRDIISRFQSENINCVGTDRTDFDLTNESETREFIVHHKPDIVIHCAAYTAVDKAETEKELCYRTNVLGTRYVARACAEIGAVMVYISTDYVFDGEGDEPFEVTDAPNPINYYGETKHRGELEVKEHGQRAFIIRVSWVFGFSENNFVKRMIKLGKEREHLSVISDQVGSPTFTYDLFELIRAMIVTDKYGTYHATNEGFCSWHEFACDIFRLARLNVTVKPIKSEEYPTAAIRPRNSRLSKKSLLDAGFDKLPEWKDALKRYMMVKDL